METAGKILTDIGCIEFIAHGPVILSLFQKQIEENIFQLFKHFTHLLLIIQMRCFMTK